MVKKLFKHEFWSYWRIMGIVYLILLTVATAGRIIQFFENDGIAYEIVFSISCVTYGICVAATLGFGFVLGIIHFYKHLFSAEGYLTLTLPVTPSQHIWVKAATAVGVQLVTILVILLSGCVITAGEMLSEIWKAAAYLLGKAYEAIGWQSIIFGCEIVALYILGLFAGIMLYYTFISIGQLFKKHRILAAVGAYFVYYIASQVVYTVLMVLFSLVSITGAFEEAIVQLAEFAQQHPYALVHSFMGICALLPIIGILVEFLIVRRIITRKLNLE